MLFDEEVFKIVVLDPSDGFDFVRIDNKAGIDVFTCKYNVVKLMLCEAVTGLSIVEDAAHYFHFVGINIIDSKLELCATHGCSAHAYKVGLRFQFVRDVGIVRAAGVSPAARECYFLESSLLK